MHNLSLLIKKTSEKHKRKDIATSRLACILKKNIHIVKDKTGRTLGWVLGGKNSGYKRHYCDNWQN